jgi:hypothetical protein
MKIDKEEIFCAVTAYNEKFLDRMIEDAYEKAHNPDALHFGIFNHKTEGNEFEDFSRYNNVKVINVRFNQPLGAAYGRLSASMLHDGQKYFSQMDAHLLFYKDWDKILLEDYLLLKEYVDKPILAQSLVCHEASVYEDYSYQKSLIERQKAYPLRLNDSGDTSADISREDEEKFLGKFLEHTLMFAGTEFFTSSDYIYEISYDPFVMYLPEQELSALRAGTRGYRFFSNGYSTMSHLGKVGDFPEEKFSDDFFYHYNSNHSRSEDFYRASYETSAYAALLGRRTGFWGAPNSESYDDYMSRFPTPYCDTIRDVYGTVNDVYNDKENVDNVFYRDLK